MKSFLSISKANKKKVRSCLLIPLIIGLSSCKATNKAYKEIPFSIEKRINQLEKRLSKIESQRRSIKSNSKTQEVNIRQKSPAMQIKSLTFRVGSEDDRLRIYWGDGTKSDLPCSKEQSVWICG